MYGDDIWIHSNKDQPLKEIKSTLIKEFEQYDFKFAPDKSIDWTDNFQYGGFGFQAKKKTVLPQKISTVANMKPPKTKNQPQKLLGCVVFIADHYPGLTEYTNPLHNIVGSLKEKSSSIQQTEEYLKQINALKEICQTPLDVDLLDLSKLLHIVGDSSRLPATSCGVFQAFNSELNDPFKDPNLKKLGFYSAEVLKIDPFF